MAHDVVEQTHSDSAPVWKCVARKGESDRGFTTTDHKTQPDLFFDLDELRAVLDPTGVRSCVIPRLDAKKRGFAASPIPILGQNPESPLRIPIGLDGTLDANLTGGFSPNVGDTFAIMTFTSRTDDFAVINGVDIGGGKVLEPSFTETSLVLEVVPQ